MMDAWKLKRELGRIQSQLFGWVSELSEPYLRKRHDAWLMQTFEERYPAPPTPRIAVFLLYQPAGIAESTLGSCQFLNRCGYSVFAISNAPISPTDRLRLDPHVWRLIERPNFGYDFGAYRDAIHLLWRDQVQFDELLLVNDSIWFPVRSNDAGHWLQSLRDRSESFCGLMELAGHRQEARSSKRKPPFLGSFFLLFKREALLSTAFRAFWTSYRMTSNKGKTIKRGERAISAEMNKAGFAMHAFFRREMLDECVRTANASTLLDMLGQVYAFDATLQRRQRALLESADESPMWVEHARSVIFEITNLQNLFVTAPLLLHETFCMPAIKKGVTFQNLIALRSLASPAHIGRVSLDPVTRQEIQSLVIRATQG